MADVVVTLWLTRHDGTCFCRLLWLPPARAPLPSIKFQQRVSTVRDNIKLYLSNKIHTSPPSTITLTVILLLFDMQSTSSPISPVHDFSTAVAHAPLRHTIAGATFSPGGVKLWERTPSASEAMCSHLCLRPGTVLVDKLPLAT